jgi:hypothetical protein
VAVFIYKQNMFGMQKISAVFSESKVFFRKIRLACQFIDLAFTAGKQVPVGVYLVIEGILFKAAYAVYPWSYTVREYYYIIIFVKSLL